MENPFTESSNSGENNKQLFFHKGTPLSSIKLARELSALLENNKKTLVLLCIGTDRATGDALGPLVGSYLNKLNPKGIEIYGTLENPVHALNLKSTLEQINSTHEKPFILAVDAALGNKEYIGYIKLSPGSIKPGESVSKVLPAVGDVHITAIVNVKGFMEPQVLQSTPLSLVMELSRIISRGIFLTLMRSKAPNTHT